MKVLSKVENKIQKMKRSVTATKYDINDTQELIDFIVMFSLLGGNDKAKKLVNTFAKDAMKSYGCPCEPNGELKEAVVEKLEELLAAKEMGEDVSDDEIEDARNEIQDYIDEAVQTMEAVQEGVDFLGKKLRSEAQIVLNNLEYAYKQLSKMK